MKNVSWITVALAVATLLGALAFSHGQSVKDGGNPPPGDGEGMRHRMPGPPDGLNGRILDQLNLTDVQREQIDTLHSTARADSAKYFDQLRANHDQVDALVTGGAFDETQARKLLANQAQLMTEMELIHLRSEAAIYALLTPDQKAMAQQIKQQRPSFPPPGFRGERPVDGK